MNPLLLLLVTVPAPPQCPWEFGQTRLLNPAMDAPLNTSFWLRDYLTIDYEVTRMSDSSTVAIETRVTMVTTTGGRLVQLRPLAPLTAGETVQISVPGGGMIGTVQVGTSSDTTAPPAPVLIQTRPNTSPYEVCATAGFFVVVEQVPEWVLELYENDDGLLELGCRICGLPSDGFIRTAANETVDFEIVHVDLAGNRSDASGDVTGMSGDVPQVTGKLPNPDDRLPGSTDRGCRCSGASRLGRNLPLDLFGWGWVAVAGFTRRRRSKLS